MPFVGGDEYVGPAHKHPEGALCAAGGCYPPLQPMRGAAPFNEQLDCARFRAAGSRPYNCGGKAADGSTDSRPLQGACEMVSEQ